MKVAVIGPICKDRNIIREDIFEQIGGVTYYTGSALSFLGASVSIYGSSTLKRSELEKYLACDELIQIYSKNTIKFINKYMGQDSDVRIQRVNDFENNTIFFNDLENISKFDYIILGPLIHDNIPRELIIQLSRVGPKIVLASQGMIRYVKNNKIVWKHPENVLDILPHIDFLFLDENELRFITNVEEISGKINFLSKKGLENIIVTLGKKGSIVYMKNKEYKIKSFPPKRLIDATGAGDSYMAGFIRALELFDDPQKQGEFAAMTATISIEEKGPFHYTLKDVYKRLGW